MDYKTNEQIKVDLAATEKRLELVYIKFKGVYQELKSKNRVSSEYSSSESIYMQCRIDSVLRLISLAQSELMELDLR